MDNLRPGRITGLAAVVGTIFLVLPFSNLQAACPEFPKVEWWGGLSHSTTSEYVNRHHQGDWSPYINMWQKQLTALKDLNNKGKTAVVRGRATTDAKKKSYSVRLKDQKLTEYIDKVAARIKVLRCLAGDPVPGRDVSTASHEPKTPNSVPFNTLVAGMRTVQKFGCLKCHGDTSVAKFGHIPNLNGQNILYLSRQLKDFQTVSGRKTAGKGAQDRHSAFMKFQVNTLNDDDVWNISAYFANKMSCPKSTKGFARPSAPPIVARCAICHGEKGLTNFPEVAKLAGQNKEYLLRQLRAFRNYEADVARIKDLSDARYHFFMSRILKKTDEAQFGPIANYYSALACR